MRLADSLRPSNFYVRVETKIHVPIMFTVKYVSPVILHLSKQYYINLYFKFNDENVPVALETNKN